MEIAERTSVLKNPLWCNFFSSDATAAFSSSSSFAVLSPTLEVSHEYKRNETSSE